MQMKITSSYIFRCPNTTYNTTENLSWKNMAYNTTNITCWYWVARENVFMKVILNIMYMYMYMYKYTYMYMHMYTHTNLMA